MGKSKWKPNIMMTISAALLCLVLITTQLVAGLYARYAVTESSADSARAAAWVFDVKDKDASKPLDLSELSYPGTSYDYSFIVTNSRGLLASEVAAEYTVTVKIAENALPVVVKLTDGATEETIDMKDRAAGEISLSGTLPSGADSEEYTLSVIWDAERSDTAYADKTTEVTLEIKAQQID